MRCWSTVAAIASRLADRSPTFGSAWAWSSTRWSWHRPSATRRVSSISSADIGLPSGAIGSAESTTMEVSLLRNTSSMKWLIEKHARGSCSPQPRCGNPVQKSRACRVAGVHPVLEEVALDVEDELVTGERGTGGVGIGGCRRRDVVAAAGLPPTLGFGFFVGARVEDEQGRRRAAHREEELSPRHPGPPGIAVARIPGSVDRLSDHGRERLGVVLAVRARPELDRQLLF